MSLLLLLKPSGGGSSTAYTLTGLAGSYSLTGGSASLSVSRKITGNAGSYALTGGSASLKVNRKLTGNAGSYLVTGGSATLTKSAGSVAYSLTGLAGVYSLSGGSASLKANRSLVGLSGAYTVTGNSATLTQTTGSQAYSLVGLSGLYQIIGGDALLTFSGTSGVGYDYDTPRKKRYVVEKNGKLLVFTNAQAASDAISDDVQQTTAVVAVKDQPKARQVVEVESTVADAEIDLEQIRAWAQTQSLIAEYTKAINESRYQALLKLYEDWREEQDLEDILAFL